MGITRTGSIGWEDLAEPKREYHLFQNGKRNVVIVKFSRLKNSSVSGDAAYKSERRLSSELHDSESAYRSEKEVAPDDMSIFNGIESFFCEQSERNHEVEVLFAGISSPSKSSRGIA